MICVPLVLIIGLCARAHGQTPSEKKLEGLYTSQEAQWKESSPPIEIKQYHKNFFRLLEHNAMVECLRDIPASDYLPEGNVPPTRIDTVVDYCQPGKEDAADQVLQENEPQLNRRRRQTGGAVGTNGWIIQIERQLRLREVAKEPRQRKEYRCLSDQERVRLHAALRRLKETRIGNTNAYDIFSVMHNAESSPGAHFGPAFLPWHRHYLTLFEQALREMDDSVSLPYLDSTLDHDMDNPLLSIIWRDDHLGTPRGEVTSGPAAGWRDNRRNLLVRQVRGAKAQLIPMASYERVMQNNNNFGAFAQALEIQHGAFHNYVNGHMAVINKATNDPLFFLHHAFIDCLWEEWRQDKQIGRINPAEDYPSDGNMRQAIRATSPMLPFGVDNQFGLRTVYTDLFYSYQPRRSECREEVGPSTDATTDPTDEETDATEEDTTQPGTSRAATTPPPPTTTTRRPSPPSTRVPTPISLDTSTEAHGTETVATDDVTDGVTVEDIVSTSTTRKRNTKATPPATTRRPYTSRTTTRLGATTDEGDYVDYTTEPKDTTQYEGGDTTEYKGGPEGKDVDTTQYKGVPEGEDVDTTQYKGVPTEKQVLNNGYGRSTRKTYTTTTTGAEQYETTDKAPAEPGNYPLGQQTTEDVQATPLQVLSKDDTADAVGGLDDLQNYT